MGIDRIRKVMWLNPVSIAFLRRFYRKRYFDALYAYSLKGAHWDTGRPQPEFVQLAQSSEIRGDILDLGCGTGENAIYLAGLGYEVWGIDHSEVAVERARSKARGRGIDVTWIVGHALNLAQLGRKFDTVIDCGLFHQLGAGKRRSLSQSLASVLKSGGTYLALSDRPGVTGGPGVTREEILATFQEGWRVNYIREAKKERIDREGFVVGVGLLSSITSL